MQGVLWIIDDSIEQDLPYSVAQGIMREDKASHTRMIAVSRKIQDEKRIHEGQEKHPDRVKQQKKSREEKLGLIASRRKNHQNFMRSMHSIFAAASGIGFVD